MRCDPEGRRCARESDWFRSWFGRLWKTLMITGSMRFPEPGATSQTPRSERALADSSSDAGFGNYLVFEVHESLQVDPVQAQALRRRRKSHDRQHSLRIPRPWRYVSRRSNQAAVAKWRQRDHIGGCHAPEKQHRQQFTAPFLQHLADEDVDQHHTLEVGAV